MERNNNKIIYCENEQKLHFFHSGQDGLCITDNSGVRVLLKNACADFDVCRLGSVIYLICQSTDGDIILLKHFNSEWHKYTLLVSKVKEAYDKNFYLLITGTCLQLFYTIKSSGRLLLIQQILCEEGTEPVVVASLHESTRPFFAVTDSDLNTYIYYQNEHGGFGCKMYKWSSKALGNFVPIISDICSYIYVLIDLYGRHHICCMCENSILYMQHSLDGEYVKQSRIPCASPAVDTPPHIRLEDEKIYIMWQQQRSVMYSFSADDANSFSAPVRILSSGEAPVFFSLQHNLKRTYSLGYFAGGDIRFFSTGARNSDTAATPNRPSPENRRVIRRSAPPEGNAADIERIKTAISALGREVSELKSKFELIKSFIENSK